MAEPHPAARRAAGYLEAGILFVTLASIWIAVAAVLVSAILDAVR